MEELKKKLRKKILTEGFDIVGFTTPKVDKETQKNYQNFLNKNYHGEMRWLERHFEKKKVNPKKIWDKVETVIVVGQNYSPGTNPLKFNTKKALQT